jgi:hypothetical protein
MNLLNYLDLPNQDYRLPDSRGLYNSIDILKKETINSIDFFNIDIALLGVPFSEENEYNSYFADNVRKELNKLASVKEDLSILDLGNIKKGKSVKDSLIALRDVLNFLAEYNIFIIAISNCNHVKKAFIESIHAGPDRSLVEIDSKFSIRNTLEYLPDDLHQQLDYTNIGYQSYYIHHEEIKWLNNNHFSAYRLGEVRSNLAEIEPAIRNAYSINISLNALKQQEAPGQKEISPNGFYSEEICQLAKYSGAADYVKIANLSGFMENSGFHTVILTAQIIWFLIFGYTIRITENPTKDPHIKKFNVGQKKRGDNLIFYRSEKTERWWVEIPLHEQKENVILPASYKDYVDACNQQIPERWLKAMQKYNFETRL